MFICIYHAASVLVLLYTAWLLKCDSFILKKIANTIRAYLEVWFHVFKLVDPKIYLSLLMNTITLFRAEMMLRERKRKYHFGSALFILLHFKLFMDLETGPRFFISISFDPNSTLVGGVSCLWVISLCSWNFSKSCIPLSCKHALL